MGDSDEIRPGDRFERVGCSEAEVKTGDIYTAARPGCGEGWLIEGSRRRWYLSNANLWRRLPRTDASAVKVGDVVKDPALLQVGMRVEWAIPSPFAVARVPPWLITNETALGTTRHAMSLMGSDDHLWIRILALPEPPKAEAQCRRDPDCVRVDGHTTMCMTGTTRPPLPPKAEPAIVPPPPRCEPGCTPKEPCWLKDVCPAWREPPEDWGQGWGISPDVLPPARASTYQPRCAELAGWGSWNGRAGK